MFLVNTPLVISPCVGDKNFINSQALNTPNMGEIQVKDEISSEISPLFGRLAQDAHPYEVLQGVTTVRGPATTLDRP